ncbi:MAG: hypothetical protein ABI574_18200 [Burkholderiales bacterium]
MPKTRGSPTPRVAAQALARRRAALVARCAALRSVLDIEVRALDRDIGGRVDQALHWLGVARRVVGVSALVLPLLMARRGSRRGLARGVHLVGRVMRAAPLALTLVHSLRELLRHRREGAAAPQPVPGTRD